jgi:hypothetical protein
MVHALVGRSEGNEHRAVWIYLRVVADEFQRPDVLLGEDYHHALRTTSSVDEPIDLMDPGKPPCASTHTAPI